MENACENEEWSSVVRIVDRVDENDSDMAPSDTKRRKMKRIVCEINNDETKQWVYTELLTKPRHVGRCATN